MTAVNPATGETIAAFDEHDDAEVERRLACAQSAFARWRATPVAERARVVTEAGRILAEEKLAFGELMTREMGKTLVSAIAEAEKCASGCRYYGEHGASFIAPDVIVDESRERGEARYEPLGIVLAVMPWNFPFWQVIRFAAPALVAGNVGILKHASNVPMCALALEDLFRRAGAPEGVFQTLLVGSSRVEGIIADPRVKAVTLTGSEGAGRSVAAAAGKYLKKTVLELGGSDPFIVLPSADLDRAAEVAVTARTINNGQSCIAAKRFIVAEAVADAFTERFVARMRALRVGDPMDKETDVGPLATSSILAELREQVEESVRQGARLLCGGELMAGPGNYFQPTVLAEIPREAPAFAQELFGPVALLFRVADVDAAITLANDSTFGLGASVWTTDAAEAERCAVEIESGSVFVNGMVASDPRFPFGGVKASGYGRELGVWGLREFVNVKTVRIFASNDGKKARAE